MSWETVIGLEIHVQLSTKSKLFSGGSTEFGAEANTHVDLIDMGLPGVLPVANKEAFYKAKEDNNVSAMVGACKTQNSAIRNFVAIKRELEYPEMWQNEMESSSPRRTHNDLDRLDNVYVHPWDKHCQEQDEIPFYTMISFIVWICIVILLYIFLKNIYRTP